MWLYFFVDDVVLILVTHRAADEAHRRANAADPDCPPGMKKMNEEQRLETLRVLTEDYKAAQVLNTTLI